LKKTVRYIGLNPRVRQVAIAVAIASVVALLTLLRPLDITLWSLQAKLFSHQPSGEIVIVTDTTGEVRKSVTNANKAMAKALVQLEKAGATRIAIDTPLRRSAEPDLDNALRDAIVNLGDKAIVAVPVDGRIAENSLRAPNSTNFHNIAEQVSGDLQRDFLGFVWEVQPAHTSKQGMQAALWTKLASAPLDATPIHPAYTIHTSSLPKVDVTQIASGDSAALAAVKGRQVVLTGMGGDARGLSAPNSSRQDVASGIIQAVAAETYMRGSGFLFGSTMSISAFGLALLLLTAISTNMRLRRLGYGVWVAALIAAFILTSMYGHRIFLIDPMVIGFVYAIQRGISNYRRRYLYVDAQSRLPNFTAFRRDLEASDNLEGSVLVIAKIARLDAIFATLKSSEQGEYLRQVATRLRLGEGDTPVFHDGGKYLSMVLRKSDYVDLEGHLEGLRAVVSQAVVIGGQPIDVAITIGVDQSYGAAVANRISSAIAAADQAREAYRPVFIISNFETDSEEWDHSLQSRLESALSENRISVKLQPKVNLSTGLFEGAEALARWTDRRHGEIPPNRFILQCERAGRLDELTKRVMKKSMDASRHLATLNLPAKVAVNVSAIQFVDSRIVDLVCMALEETRADPRNLMIEITETARIEDIRQASAIVEEIKALGLGFSIDDFGVGSGNLAALYELPFDELKIDRMFANEVGRSDRARAVVEALLKLSRDLGIRSVAEGIDDLSILEILKEMGGDLAQGFCIARPMTLPLLEETLKLQSHTGELRLKKG